VQSFSISGRGKAKPRKSSRICCDGHRDGFIDIEQRLDRCGLGPVAGVDEAGRGPLAGPVVAASVILRADAIPAGIRDSKKLSARRRDDLYKEIRHQAVSIGTGICSPWLIDRLNILEATMWAMTEAVLSMDVRCRCAVIDGNRLPDLPMPLVGVVKGDDRCASVAAASIVAKVVRDRLMDRLDVYYPRYNLRHNKGYGTREHMRALVRYGPTRIHRLTFEPVLNALGRRMR
jgi:ribonuclease HII